MSENNYGFHDVAIAKDRQSMMYKKQGKTTQLNMQTYMEYTVDLD